MKELNEGIYTFYVYVLTNVNKTVLYTGVTNNLPRRLYEHEEKLNPNSFTSKYNVKYLIYFEKFSWIQLAIEREKDIKNLSRQKKLNLILGFNPDLEFLNYRFKYSDLAE